MLERELQSRIDALFSEFTEPGSPGCALGIMRDGDLAYAQGYGLANLEHGIEIEPSTIFYIASMAKQFTGLAIAILADQGRLDLDADIRTLLPYVPDFGHRITTKHLLYHTSGLRSDIFLLMLSGWRVEDVIRQEDILEFVKHQQDLDFVPGTEFAYCGTGYSLLAEIVTTVTGQPFPEFCREQIFEPLGMTHTRFEDDPIALVPGRASAYFQVPGGEFKNAVLTIGILGGTGVFTTIEDLARWDENFYTGAVGGMRALEMMQRPGTLDSGEKLSYAFGLTVETHAGRDVIAHAGDSAGVHCYMMRFPNEHMSIAVLGNASTVRASGLAQGVADLLLEADTAENDPESQAPGAPSPVEVPSDVLAARSGRYFDPVSSAFIEIPFDGDSLSIYGYALAPSSESEFSVPEHPEATVRFVAAASGVLSATIDIGNGPTTYSRVEPVHPTQEELEVYAGTYWSPEVDVRWIITLDDDGLRVHRRRQGVSHLTPMCADVFTDPWVGEILHGNAQWVIAFDRDGADITGLRVTAAGGRGRNLRFERIGD